MEVIQENIVVIGGALAALLVVVIVLMMIKKRRKKKGEQAAYMVPSKESIEPIHEETDTIEVNEEEEGAFEAEKELFDLVSVNKGHRYFSLQLAAKEKGLRITSIKPSKNAYGSIYKLDELNAKTFHPKKPVLIHFDFTDRAAKRTDIQFETNLCITDSEGNSWTQRFIFDKTGDSRLLKPRRA